MFTTEVSTRVKEPKTTKEARKPSILRLRIYWISGYLGTALDSSWPSSLSSVMDATTSAGILDIFSAGRLQSDSAC